MKNAERDRLKTIEVRNYLLIFLVVLCSSAFAQTHRTTKMLENSRLLVRTIFETKDSAVLQSLFASEMTHTVARNKVQSREEAIRNISNNRSVFVQADMMVGGYGVTPAKDSTIIKYFYKGRENKPDGTSSPFATNVVMVWVKKKKDIKLIRLETIRID